MEQFIISFADGTASYALLILLIGGGLYFTIYSQFTPFRYFWHGVDVLSGKYDDKDKNMYGDITRWEALASSLAATVGMGNISGVAIAIVTGGPGALFWMWVCAILGMATKFFTCTLSVMYRGKDSEGNWQGGPMYFIEYGLGKNWKPFAMFFCLAGLGGSLPLFQANQLTQVLRDMVLIPNGYTTAQSHFYTDLYTGLVLAVFTSMIIFGGIQRIAKLATALVPFMVLLYCGAVIWVILLHLSEVPACFYLIFEDAFSGKAVAGGIVGIVILKGVQRAAFSNEAGIGTAPMMHGATKSNEPVREGLTAMLGPFIDTVVVCSMTALAILITGVWKNTTDNAITVTAKAFATLPYAGVPVLILSVLIFSLTTLFSYSYYGNKCLGYLAGAKYASYYNYFYILSIVFGAVASVRVAFSVIDIAYACMAIPTVISTILLSGHVKKEAKIYFDKMFPKKK